MANLIKRRAIHSGRLERWLGADKIERLSNNFRHGGGVNVPWYGPPVNLTDVPGNVWVTGDGDFIGDFHRGFAASAADSMADHVRALWRQAGKPIYAVGFTGIADFIQRQAGGYRQFLGAGQIAKNGPTGTANTASSLWLQGTNPAAGGVSSAAPGGRALTKATAGTMGFQNPSSGNLYLSGADLTCTVQNNSLMIYDRLFDVAKIVTITTAETVTGVPTRFSSTTTTSLDYISGNFVFIEVVVANLGAGAHNHTNLTYTNQAGTTGLVAANIAGIASQPQPNFDMPANTWFAPLLAGDTGVREITSIQLSASTVSGGLQYVIAHPIGICMFPHIAGLIPFDWITLKNPAPYIPNDAALALFEFPKPSTTATNYSGSIQVVNAP